MQREALIEAIFASMQKMHRSGTAKFHALTGQQDISLSQMELLVTVKRLEPVSVKAIAAQMRLTPGAVTQLMEGLVSRQYLLREPDTHDRRVTNVCLSATGKERLHEIWGRRKAMLHKIVESLDDDELAVMLRVQEKMLQHIEDCSSASQTEA